MRHKFEVGKLYKIRFYDHAIGTKEKIVCEVAGWVLHDEKEHITLTYWVVDSKDEQVKKDNIEPVVIIKSCITRKRKIS